MASEDELIAARRRHAEQLLAAGGVAYPHDFKGDDHGRRRVVEIATDPERCAQLPTEDELEEQPEVLPLYGRVTAKRGPFLVISTPHGSAQALVRPDNLSPDDAARFKTVDLADHIAVWGPLLRTKTGALTVRAQRYQHLAKALLPPPAKWHGLSDVEKRYRERYVDLFANPEVSQLFRARGLIVSAIRSFLTERGFLEVETPILHPLLGGATARPFKTHHNALDIPLYLRVAPELYLKRLIVGGLDRVFELGRTFRNEGVSTRHNPEFTMLELYMAYASYDDLADLVETLLQELAARLATEFPDLGRERKIDLTARFPRVTMRRAIVDAAGRAGEVASGLLDEATVYDESALESACATLRQSLSREQAQQLDKCRSYGDRVLALFEIVAEPRLEELYKAADGERSLPVFITEYPVEDSPLARRNDEDRRFVDRFELFAAGREVANAFDELNDPDDQAERFRAQLANRARGDAEAMDYDHDYIRALQHGMPPTAGLGIGIDRLIMLLCDQASIREVLLFPLLKPDAK